jgi:hypothetical protein
MTLGSTQPLIEMSTRNFTGVKGDRRIGLTNLPPFVSPLSRQNLEASTSHNPMGLHGLLQGELQLFRWYRDQVNLVLLYRQMMFPEIWCGMLWGRIWRPMSVCRFLYQEEAFLFVTIYIQCGYIDQTRNGLGQRQCSTSISGGVFGLNLYRHTGYHYWFFGRRVFTRSRNSISKILPSLPSIIITIPLDAM